MSILPKPSTLHRWPIFRLRITRLLVLILLICISLYQYNRRYSSSAREAPKHEITSADIEFAVAHVPNRTNASLHHGFLPLADAEELCARQSWQPWLKRDGRRKVYSLFMINDELDMLEVHLSTLYGYVDYFVIVESPVTFTNLQKPLILKDNWARIEKWSDKVIHHVLENPPIGAPRPWDYEDFQRNAMFLQTFPKMVGEKEPKKGDVIIVTDVDEIMRPAAVMLLRECETKRRMTLRNQFYYYSFQWRHVGPQWELPKATTFGGFGNDETILPADLRNGEGGNRLAWLWEKDELWNAGWHCSTCFGSVEEVLRKMDSFSHQGLNQGFFRDPTRIVDRVRKGLDLWDREGQKYARIHPNEDIPEILKADRERWKYMLDRDAANAEFRDVELENIPGE
ncbi:related to beta-1,4-mannosyl-glycoprotein 4-beta-N-acetylglucosaminyltransferase [Phialocephala subalpina]|uniref:Related to beta-1,4-mannosyl-glycoprotein 4-beta-N-acetylglucosaminyltransferase n=1 Tax=Phialocephala subalpina TaxID=576137 RepID=A0A1L7WMD9_9HELO|nr:related to beta-1,4-mannosyl-glycoprotein 4-beta-N-acetylglucosaminyltransferase [Phialocephala subalpina]